MGRGGVVKTRENGPERKCAITGEVQPKAGLIRFVVDPEGRIVPDIAGKLPGRGVYVTSERSALEKAVAKKVFARGLKQQVVVPDALLDTVEQLMTARVVDLISLARKSGDAVSGYERVKDWLEREEATVLLQAVDGSGRGKSKLSTPHYGLYIGWLSADELGRAFGRETVIHAALGSGGLARRVVEEAQRLKGLREVNGGNGHREGR